MPKYSCTTTLRIARIRGQGIWGLASTTEAGRFTDDGQILDDRVQTQAVAQELLPGKSGGVPVDSLDRVDDVGDEEAPLPRRHGSPRRGCRPAARCAVHPW